MVEEIVVPKDSYEMKNDKYDRTETGKFHCILNAIMLQDDNKLNQF